MSFGKRNDDGTLASSSTQQEGFVDLVNFEKDGEGYFIYYIEADIGGFYAGDTATELIEAQEAKYNDIWAEYQRRVDETAQTGYAGRDTNKQKGLNDKSNKRLTKKSNGGSLSPSEEADEEWYDAYMDWADYCHNTADSACDTVELMTTADEVNDYDEVNDPVWPDFVAP